jgi:hypothetical protein
MPCRISVLGCLTMLGAQHIVNFPCREGTERGIDGIMNGEWR